MSQSRVLIISAHFGEMDRRIISEANALAESGRTVTLVSVPTLVPDNCLHPAVQLVIPSSEGTPAQQRGWLKSLAYTTARVVISYLAPQLHYWRARRSNHRYFLQCTPHAAYDAIHCHDLDTLPIAETLRASLAPTAKLIYDAHELYPYQLADRSFQRYWSAVEKQFIRGPDLVITVNEAIADQFVELYGIRRPAVIFNSYGNLWNQAPLSAEAFLRHFGVPAGRFNVLFQGSLTTFRNLPNLVRAFAILDPSCRLFILGSGPLEAELRKTCSSRGIGNVSFGGHIPQAELLRYTAHADLGMIPYEDAGLINMRYCSPNKLFEFIEAKVPVCVSMLPELSRLVTENKIGAAYTMRSPDEIAAAICDCRQRCERGEFTNSTRENARQKFAWSVQSKRLLALYDELGVK